MKNKKLVIGIFLIAFVNTVFAQISFIENSGVQSINVSHGTTNIVGGLAFFDFDNDGWDDLTYASEEGFPIYFFKNNNGTFNSVNLNFTDYFTDTRQINWVDIDNDGDNDLFLVSNNASNRLYENDGSMNFTDITSSSGISMDVMLSWGASWGDYNNDGYLDLFISNRDILSMTKPNLLYKNNGDNTFLDVSSAAGISPNSHLSFCSVFFDYNNDGWQDIYIVNDKHSTQNILYKNVGNGTFIDVSVASGTAITMDAMSTTVEDYNYDGWLDIYITNTESGNYFLLNNGNGTFTNIAPSNGTIFESVAWGAVFLDADNDSDQDLYVSGMFDGSSAALPSAFYENSGEGNFSIPPNAGFDNDTARSYSNAIGDINNDGYPDITVINNTPDYNFLWMNNSSNNTNNNWLKVTLEGTASNRMGIGSWIEIQSNGILQNRYKICGEGYISQNSGSEFFGLGNNTIIDYVKVTWLSGIVDILYNVNANQKLHIVESSTLSNTSFEAVNLSITPNPSHGDITINTTLIDYEVNLYNVLGTNLFSKSNLSKASNHNFKQLKSGVYFLKITANQQEFTKRIIIR